MTSLRWTLSNQRWNNVTYVNAGIYSVEQCRIHVVFLNVDMNNVWQRWNIVAFFNVEFHNVGQRQNNVVKMAISETLKNKLQ